MTMGRLEGELKEIVSTTDGLGLVHESVNSWNTSDWTRQWFSWVSLIFTSLLFCCV